MGHCVFGKEQFFRENKIYAVTLSIGFSRRFSPKSGFWGLKGGLLTWELVHRKESSLLHFWPTFQISGRSDKNCGRYRGRNVLRTHTQTHTQINTQVILYLSNAMNCIGQTMMRTVFSIKCLVSRSWSTDILHRLGSSHKCDGRTDRTAVSTRGSSDPR